jgi:hypothetical protein
MAKVYKPSLEEIEQHTSPPRTSLPKGFVEVSSGLPLAKPGDIVIGVYVGPGKPKKVKQKLVDTYIIAREGTGEMVTLLASAQIQAFFATVKPKQTVYIERVGKVAGGQGGSGVNTYRFAVRV